jgi:flagellar hook-associated protein 2
MSSITFSGLGSGLDTSSLISQLVSVEKQPAILLQNQQQDLSSQKSIVDSLAGQVSSLGDLIGGMSLTSDVQFRTATSSDAHVSVAVSSDAVTTSHDIRVQQTAKAQVVTSRALPSQDAGALGDGSVTLNGSTTVSWSSTDSLANIASKINDANAGVSASVLYDGTSYRMVMTSQKTGTSNATTFADSGDGLDFSNAANLKVPAQDAKLTIDGISITRPSNVIDDALAGVTITANSAQAATDPDSQVNVTLDTTAAQAKLQAFVDQYNQINGAINNQLAYTGTTKGPDTLFGDSTLSQLQNSLQGLVSQTFGSSSLLDLGISVDKDGVMSLDADKFGTALSSNPNALGDLFVTGGLSKTLTDLTNMYTEPSDGILTSKSSGLSTQSDDLQTQIDQINSNADALQTRLQTQFDALEETMSKLQSQASYVSKILA